MGLPRVRVADRGGDSLPPEMTQEVAAEAAVWVARLHGPDRSVRMGQDCLAWQARSAAHRQAFERCTETWQDVAGLTLDSAYDASEFAGSAPVVRLLRSARWALALALAGVLAGGAAMLARWGDASYFTGLGEQQVVLLKDGTRMSLNTGTRVRVDIDSDQRTVRVVDGEAVFEVVPDARRPFLVRAAGSEVVAVGTVFAVRWTGAPDKRVLAVTLIEGRITVRPAPSEYRAGGFAPLTMQPGERVRLARPDGASRAMAQPRIDWPSIEQVTAWRRSEAVFDDMSLSDAVDEMNRYSRTPILLVGEAASSGIRISGVYRTGDNTGFARAVAALHGLELREHADRLVLSSRN